MAGRIVTASTRSAPVSRTDVAIATAMTPINSAVSRLAFTPEHANFVNLWLEVVLWIYTKDTCLGGGVTGYRG